MSVDVLHNAITVDARDNLPTNAPYGVEGMKKFIFLHGANVSEPNAEIWGDQLFKRLWHTGCQVDFYNVDWRSDIGSGANYHQNASNAFEVAAQLVTAITNIPGDKVIMAHSLGNMVVSSMIQDHGLQVSKYLMCDSAVPSEAYYPTSYTSTRVPQLVHPDWSGYPTNSWASSWHRLFADDETDDRRLLGWPGRFKDVAQYAVNFYSTGDEVLELYENNSISFLSGITSGYVQYSWHHQELWKGRGMMNGGGGTTWAGWNIEEDAFGVDRISATQAQTMDATDPSMFKTNTVFYLNPPSMNATNITLLLRGAILTQGIPALTRPTGATNIVERLGDEGNFNLDSTDMVDGIQRPNGWPTRWRWDDRWLHSDMKDVSYLYNFMFYKKIKEKGGI